MSTKPTFWQYVRRILMELLVGLGLGVTVWELIGRKIIALNYDSLGSTVTCATDVEQALAQFDSGLRLSALIGAIAFVVLMVVIRILLWRKRQQKAKVAVGAGAAAAKPGGAAAGDIDESPPPAHRTTR
jgi:hypothetical protein